MRLCHPKGTPSPKAGGLNQELEITRITLDSYSHTLASLPALRGSHPAQQVRYKLKQRHPDVASHMNSNASDSILLPSFDCSHIQQVCRTAPTHHSVAHGARHSCGYSTSLPVMAHCRFLTPTGGRPSQVISIQLHKTTVSSSCCLSDGTSVSPSVCAIRTGFRGRRIP